MLPFTIVILWENSAIFVRKGSMDGQKDDRPPRSYPGDLL